MDIFEKLGSNPLYVSLITLVATTVIGAIGYLLKKCIDQDIKEHKDVYDKVLQSIREMMGK